MWPAFFIEKLHTQLVHSRTQAASSMLDDNSLFIMINYKSLSVPISTPPLPPLSLKH